MPLVGQACSHVGTCAPLAAVRSTYCPEVSPPIKACLSSSDSSVTMAFDAVDAMLGGSVGSTIHELPDASRMDVDEIRAASEALQLASVALMALATARDQEPSVVVDGNDSDETVTYPSVVQTNED